MTLFLISSEVCALVLVLVDDGLLLGLLVLLLLLLFSLLMLVVVVVVVDPVNRPLSWSSCNSCYQHYCYYGSWVGDECYNQC